MSLLFIKIIIIFLHSKNDLAYEIVPFTGRSDYGPFIEVDIPGIILYWPMSNCIMSILAGGLFTGAEQLKTQQQFEDFGGIINAPLDPCYHQVSTHPLTQSINLYFFELVL